MKQIEKVALIGLGAMGSFFAPRLRDTLGDGGFRVVASGARRERLEQRGVTINGEVSKFAVVEPGTVDPVDLVIIGVKSTALPQALEDIRGLVGESTIIMPLLNGVDSEEKVAAAYGWDRVLYSFMRTNIVMADGACRYDPQKGYVAFGERDNSELSERTLAVKDLLERADIPFEIPKDLMHEYWFKYMANVGQNLAGALLGVPVGALLQSEHVNYIRLAAMEEVREIAAKKGIILGEEEMKRQEEVIRGLPYHNKMSTAQDLDAGRKTEIQMFAGEVVRMGGELGVPTPVNKLLYHAIRALEEKNDGLFD